MKAIDLVLPIVFMCIIVCSANAFVFLTSLGVSFLQILFAGIVGGILLAAILCVPLATFVYLYYKD